MDIVEEFIKTNEDLIPLLDDYSMEVLVFDFKENFMTQQYVGHDISILLSIWKKQLIEAWYNNSNELKIAI